MVVSSPVSGVIGARSCGLVSGGGMARRGIREGEGGCRVDEAYVFVERILSS